MQASFIHFQDISELNNWVVINDTVMGGESRADISINEGFLAFSGKLSLRNNGGFASTRRVYSPIQWFTQRAIRIVVLGDGRDYQLRIRTNNSMDGVAYVANFSTKAGTQQTLVFTQRDFVPQYRGRFVRNSPKLDFKDISQLGFMLADKTPGEFELKVKEIRQADNVF